MALHGPDNRVQVLPHGEVMTEGYSFDLALDQLGIFSTKQRSKKGLKAISDFTAIDVNAEKLKMLVGTPDQIGVMGTNKDASSVNFTIKDIVKVGIAKPKHKEQKVDYWRVGWDGVNPETALKFYEGQELEFNLVLEGMPVTMFNANHTYSVKVPIIIPSADDVCGVEGVYNCEPVAAKEHTLNLVRALNNYDLPTGRKLSEVVEVTPILSTPSQAQVSATKKYFTLEYKGVGDLHELGKVQASYPGTLIVKDTLEDKFVMLADAKVEGSEVDFVPAPFVVEFNGEDVSIDWVEQGTVTAVSKTYEIQVADEQGLDVLSDLNAEYPQLTITKESTTNCISTYRTDVISDFVAVDGCNVAILEKLYAFEAPRRFGMSNYWYPVVAEGADESDILCGFEVKAKPFIMNPSEPVLDKVPFILTSTRIASISGGYAIDYHATTRKVGRPFNTVQLERAQDLDNLGGRLRGWEKRGNIYFRNEQYVKDPVERYITSTQSKLDGLVQYALAYVEIEKVNKAGINEREYTNISYGFLIPDGKTEKVEDVLTALATKAGVPFLIQ